MYISHPLLPPKAGYVETVNENGERVYKVTPEATARRKKELETSLFMQSIGATMNAILNINTLETSDLSEEPQIDIELRKALEFNKAVQLFAMSIEDETTMMAIASVYPSYQVGVAYKIGDIFYYGLNSVGDPQLYQVLQAHTSAEEWPPDSATSLYKKVGVSEDGTPLWVQPLGATDAYNSGDIVMHNNKKWKSEINANVWEPGVYGWVEVTNSEEPSGDIPDYVQPSGAHDAYNIGDRVKFTDGHIYESLIDGNTWSPTEYPQGWKLIE